MSVCDNDLTWSPGSTIWGTVHSGVVRANSARAIYSWARDPGGMDKADGDCEPASQTR
jgi:hypothetical protein